MNEDVWLVELGCNPPEWWTGRGTNRASFDPEAGAALRFARFEDAEVGRVWLVEAGLREGTKSTEHLFVADAAARGAVPHAE